MAEPEDFIEEPQIPVQIPVRFRCNVCDSNNKTFDTLEELKKHTPVHYTHKLSCPDCGFISIDRGMHDQHFTAAHIPSSQKGQRKKIKHPVPNKKKQFQTLSASIDAETKSVDLVTECYDHACGKSPTSIEHLMGLFNCQVHEHSFVKQQKTTIKMYKLVPEERYVLWTICSIQLQVFGIVEPDRLLNLTELLFNKHNIDHGLKEPEAILMYISVLEQRSKYKDALAILSGVLGAHIVLEVARLHMKGRLLTRACDYAKAAEVLGNVLEAWFTADNCWANQPTSKDMEKMKRDLALAKNASLFRYLERKLSLKQMEAVKKCILKPMTWTRIKIPMMKIEEAADLK